VKRSPGALPSLLRTSFGVPTAKRLNRIAQGCRAERLPWDAVPMTSLYPERVVEDRGAITKPRWGIVVSRLLAPQGSHVGLSVPLALMLVLGSSVAFCAADEPKITVELHQNEVFEGQAVDYRVTVENVENPKPPEVPAAADYDVALLGQQSLNSQQITVVNGVMQRVVHRGRQFDYRITPKRSGVLTIAGPVTTVGSQTLTGEEKRLKVLPPSAQDIVAVELKAGGESIYPTQPFTVILSGDVKELPPPVASRDPLSVQRSPPMLRIPWLTDQELPSGLSPKEDWKTWVKGFLDSDNVGFGMNDLVQQTAFSLLGENSVLAFRPKPRSVKRSDARGNEAAYRCYEFTRSFTAKQAGPIAFGAVSLQGTFVTHIESERMVGKEIYAVSKPLVITVKDIPAEGRPDDFSGAIGHFQWTADLAPRQAKVGDPVTLTLTLRGTGSTAAVQPLDLSKIPAVASRFKIYEATQQAEGDGVRFVYSLRPLAEGDEPFPALATAYFDVDQEKYVTIQSGPIPLTVANAERLSNDAIVTSPRTSRQEKELEASREGIFANITDPTMARDQTVYPARWLAGLGGCVGFYCSAAALAALVRRRTQDKSALRRWAAVKRARLRVRKAAAVWQSQHIQEAADLFQEAMAGLVADAAGLCDASLTPRDVLRQLEAWDVPAATIAETRRLLDMCDAARYGGAVASSDLGNEAHQVVEGVIKILRAQKRFR